MSETVLISLVICIYRLFIPPFPRFYYCAIPVHDNKHNVSSEAFWFSFMIAGKIYTAIDNNTVLAKQLGAKRTIARISNTEFISNKDEVGFTKFGIDELISPEALAAAEIRFKKIATA